MAKPKFKNLQAELDFWAGKTIEERKALIKKWNAPARKRADKALIADFIKWRRSGSRT